MKRKIDAAPFSTLLSLYLERVGEIASAMGYSVRMKTDRQFFLRASFQLQAAVESKEVTAALGLSMTSLVLTVSLNELDKPDPTIARHAIDFAVEKRLLIAEVILTGDDQEARGAY